MSSNPVVGGVTMEGATTEGVPFNTSLDVMRPLGPVPCTVYERGEAMKIVIYIL